MKQNLNRLEKIRLLQRIKRGDKKAIQDLKPYKSICLLDGCFDKMTKEQTEEYLLQQGKLFDLQIINFEMIDSSKK